MCPGTNGSWATFRRTRPSPVGVCFVIAADEGWMEYSRPDHRDAIAAPGIFARVGRDQSRRRAAPERNAEVIGADPT